MRATRELTTGEVRDSNSMITLEDLGEYTLSEMAFMSDGHPMYETTGFGVSDTMVIVANGICGPHRGSEQQRELWKASGISESGSGKWDIGDRVMVDGQRAQIIELNGGNAVVEIGGRDGGQTRSVVNDDKLLEFTWVSHEEGTSVELRWDSWKEFHPDANVIEEFDHLHLVLWDNPHSECAFPSEKWVPNNMIRLPGEGGSGAASLVLSGAGCETVNGTYIEDDEYKGRPLYTNKATNLQIWWNGQWRLGTTNNYYYQLSPSATCVCGSEAFPWAVSTQTPNANTCEPAPTVTMVSCK